MSFAMANLIECTLGNPSSNIVSIIENNMSEDTSQDIIQSENEILKVHHNIDNIKRNKDGVDSIAVDKIFPAQDNQKEVDNDLNKKYSSSKEKGEKDANSKTGNYEKNFWKSTRKELTENEEKLHQLNLKKMKEKLTKTVHNLEKKFKLLKNEMKNGPKHEISKKSSKDTKSLGDFRNFIHDVFQDSTEKVSSENGFMDEYYEVTILEDSNIRQAIEKLKANYLKKQYDGKLKMAKISTSNHRNKLEKTSNIMVGDLEEDDDDIAFRNYYFEDASDDYSDEDISNDEEVTELNDVEGDEENSSEKKNNLAKSSNADTKRFSFSNLMNIFLTCIVFPMLAAFYFSLLWEEVLRALENRNRFRFGSRNVDEEALSKRQEIVKEMDFQVIEIKSEIDDLCAICLDSFSPGEQTCKQDATPVTTVNGITRGSAGTKLQNKQKEMVKYRPIIINSAIPNSNVCKDNSNMITTSSNAACSSYNSAPSCCDLNVVLEVNDMKKSVRPIEKEKEIKFKVGKEEV
ncbi:hypothetical protein HK099_005621 [Clydaea vesicula]|uniref:Uncharacterized protein n=1 Tax=Clydaea vesicula TaxID=447962 RepID=A0AAD5TYY9_9FUNG|nr:hypothetical protein HK099_005621 [Clydaea vesicula]